VLGTLLQSDNLPIADTKSGAYANAHSRASTNSHANHHSSRHMCSSLESYYTDASVWTPYCASFHELGVVGSCPAPMCKISASMLATSRRHTFLGTSLIQAGTGIADDMLIIEGKTAQEEL